MRSKSVSIRTVWMGAYLMVVILMCTVFFIGIRMVASSVEENARQVNEESTSVMQKFLDDSWQRVFENNMQIINNSRARRLDQAGEEAFRGRTVYEMSLEFGNYTLSNRMVEDIYLYYPESGYVIGRKGVYPLHLYWASLYGVSKEYAEQFWETQLFGSRSNGYFTVKNGQRTDLYYRIAVPSLKGRILVAKINNRELANTLGWIRADSESSFIAMIDEHEGVYAFSGNYEQFVDGQSNRLLETGTKYLQTELLSDVTSLRYVTIKEKTLAYYQSVTIMRLSVAFLLFAFLSGIGASAILVRRNAQPVQEIANKLRKGAAVTGNELHMIQTQVDELLEENKLMLGTVMQQQSLMIRRAFLSECLSFGSNESRDAETIAAIYGLSFENSRFALLVRERSGTDYSDKVIEWLGTMDSEHLLCCWSQKQDLDIFLLNYDDAKDRRSFEDGLREISCEGSRILTSQEMEDMGTIRPRYLDCLRQLHRKAVALEPFSPEPDRAFNEVKQKTIQDSFQKYLAEQSYRNAKHLIGELCSAYARMEDPMDQACCRYGIAKQLLNVGGGMLRRPLQQFVNETAPEQLESRLTELLNLCIQSESPRQSGFAEYDVAGKARCVIDEMYANPMLDLRIIAEESGVSQSYVSRMFKKKYGIGISQYINQVRLQHTKELIRSGQQNIKAIAVQVGYSSDMHLIRVFKKYENTTPSLYREEGAKK